MYEATLTGASKELRATVQAVGDMLDMGKTITATTLSARLSVNRGTASRRVTAAIKRGWIVNRETKKGQPWDLQMGEPLPETQGLPSPEVIRKCCAGVAECCAEDATPQLPIIVDKNSECCTVAGHTDGSFSSPNNECLTAWDKAIGQVVKVVVQSLDLDDSQDIKEFSV